VDVEAGTRFDVGAAAGAPHPATNNMMDVQPTTASMSLVLCILASMAAKTELSRPTMMQHNVSHDQQLCVLLQYSILAI
jgi:hypothetical protein